MQQPPQEGMIVNGVPVDANGQPLNTKPPRVRRPARRSRIGARLAIGIVVVAVLGALKLFGIIGNPSVNSFYTISHADYNAFDVTNNNAPAPTETDNFPSQTSDLAVYFSVDSADAGHTKYQLTLYNKSGVMHKYDSHVLDHDKISIADDIGPGDPLPNGSYRLDLSIDGKVASSHTFTVGS